MQFFPEDWAWKGQLLGKWEGIEQVQRGKSGNLANFRLLGVPNPFSWERKYGRESWSTFSSSYWANAAICLFSGFKLVKKSILDVFTPTQIAIFHTLARIPSTKARKTVVKDQIPAKKVYSTLKQSNIPVHYTQIHPNPQFPYI